MKTLLIVFGFLTVVSLLGFALSFHFLAHDFHQYSWLFYLTVIVGGFSLNAQIPIYYEATVERLYPVSEGLTTGVLTTISNIGSFIFLLVAQAMPKAAGTTWMNWCVIGGAAISTLLLFFFNE